MRAIPANHPAWDRVTRDQALIEQGGRCKYCKGHLPRWRATRDHRVPRSKNGTDHRSNISAACEPCNVAKGSHDERLFMRMLHGQAAALHWGIKVRATIRRLNVRADRAVTRILRSVGTA